MSSSRILVLVGSLRAASVNKQVAHVAAAQAPEGTEVEVVERLDALPFYNQDLDTDDAPAAVADLRRKVSQADGLLLVTPENNGSLSAVLKNAVDWLSRPRGAACLDGVPTGVIIAGLGMHSVHEHAHTVLKVAGAEVLRDLTTRLHIPAFEGAAPADRPEVVEAVQTVLAGLLEASAEVSAA